MAVVHRFTLPWAVADGRDVFMAGLGLFSGGVLDVDPASTTLIAALQSAAGVTDAGMVNNSISPAPVPAGNPDPYPQYLTPEEAAGAVTGGIDPIASALKAAYVPKWRPSTAYAAGDPVLNPSAQIVTANTAHTSGTTYNSANWTVVSGGGGTVSDATASTKGVVQLAGDLAGTAAVPTVTSGAHHTHTSSQVSDSTTVGRSVLTAADAPTARTAIGAGTGNVTGTGLAAVQVLTQAAYTALGSYSATTLYVIVG